MTASRQDAPAARFLAAAQSVLDGRITDINVRASGSLRLFVAGKGLQYGGYAPDQEWLKGLICRLGLDGTLAIVAPCFRKFYNFGERRDIDAEFLRLLRENDVTVHFPEKIDGTNIRFYVHPETGEVIAPTRGMLDGGQDVDEEGELTRAYIHFGREALAIARERHPAILEPKILERLTPIFELLHPRNRIVTDYGDRRELILLAVVDKADGCRELCRVELEAFAAQYGLTLVPTLEVDWRDWDAAFASLLARFDGTDREGVVATVERGGTVVLRVKFKAPRYLFLMRLTRHCTLRRTAECAAEWGTATWESFRDRLLTEFEDLPEEVLEGYRGYFTKYAAYEADLAATIAATESAYEAFVAQHPDISQKDFALAIADRADKHAWFFLRKLGPADRTGARVRILEMLRKQRPLRDDDASF